MTTGDEPVIGIAAKGGDSHPQPVQPAGSLEVNNAGRWVLVATIMASSMVYIDSSVLNVALPALQESLHASGAQLLWIMNAYLLMLAAFIMLGGSMGDRLGRRKVLAIGIALFMAGSMAAGAAFDASFLIGARVVQGIGGALMIPGSLALITAFYESKSRGRAIGTWAAATTGVTVVGPVMGGALADTGLWRGVFWINLPIGLAALLVLRYRVKESRNGDSRRRLDYSGGLLAAVGLACLTYGFLAAPKAGFGSPQVIATLSVGWLALILFGIVESRSAYPMVPLGIFRNRIFSGANLITLFLYGALNVTVFFLALNLVQIQGYSPTVAGLTFLPFAILLALLSRWAGILTDRVGARLPMVAGTMVTAAGLMVMATVGVTNGPSDFWTSFFPGILLFGLGLGVTVAPLTTTVMGALDAEWAGTASGINNAVSRISSVFTTAIVGALALMAFTGALEDRGAFLNLPPSTRADLRLEAAKLGGAQVPDSVPADMEAPVEHEIKQGFVDAFRIVLFISAGMILISSIIAATMIGGRPHGRRNRLRS